MIDDVSIHNSWKSPLKAEFEKEYFNKLSSFVKSEYEKTTVYPSPKNIFSAFNRCPLDKVKVVILGQDPYHGPDQANGLCFSVNDGVRVPPSLKNIYKEINADLGLEIPSSGNLEHWADQGVLLLNTTLTVQARNAGSHQKMGWEDFTDAVVALLSEKHEGLVFMLWGRYAQNKGAVIDREKHLVLTAPHPSPFSAHSGFFGSKHFSKANEYLAAKGVSEINWANKLK
ncbi:uracil-DNA glycosylase [Candidatus Peregrinibacteria bacterium]|jgi:uracil-DNA glycosylase|nr:uracil-DNA glycosylase [Candidatus Peregrinibacteria bacterium]MBT4631445.1 uracil-DNA glycosylase [Candidatus Peregrinibacteria bacterium]MBT5823834.1 uracil-DNA glycosylase [Candidatus Peregrinibacteria bacterium]